MGMRKGLIKYILPIFLLLFLVLPKLKSQDGDPLNKTECGWYFEAMNRNMWGPEGQPFNIDIDYDLFWIEESFNQSIGQIWTDPLFGTRWGALIEIDFWMLAGMRFSMHGFSTGSIDVRYGGNIVTDFPDDLTFNPGQTITVESQWTPTNDWELTTHFPTAGWVSLDFFWGVHFMIDAQICVGACMEFDFGISNPTHQYDSINIFYLNTFTGEYNYPCIENGIPQFCSGEFLPIIIPDFFGIGLTGYITIPYVETESWMGSGPDFCLYAHGDSMWWGFQLDIITFIGFVAQFIPPPAGPVISQVLGYINGSIELLPGVTISWNLISMEIGMDSHMTQDFTFCPDIKTRLTFPTPVSYTEVDATGTVVSSGVDNTVVYQVNNDLNFDYPCFDWPQMPVQVDHLIGNSITNHTWDSLAFWFHISILSITIEIHLGPIDDALPGGEMPPLVFDIPVECEDNPDSICFVSVSSDTLNIETVQVPELDISQTIGPLYEQTWHLGYIPLTWFNQTWTLLPTYDTLCGFVNLIPLPPMEMELDFCQPLICYGDSIACIMAVVQNGNPPYTYEWSTGEINTHEMQVDSLQNLHEGFYSVTVTDITGCSITDTISVYPLNPPLYLSIAKIDVTCERGSDGVVSALPSGGTPPYTYYWEPGAYTSQTVANLPSDKYCVTVTDDVGCTITDCDTLIELHPIPPADFILSPKEGCQPLEVSFYEISPDEGQTYQWWFGDGGTGDGQNPTWTYHENGVYDVTLQVTSIYGCDSVITKYQAVDVWEKPVARFDVFPNRVDLYDPQVFFTNQSSAIFQNFWDFGDGGFSYDVHPTYRYQEPGKYTVTLIVSSDRDCKDTAQYEFVFVDDWWSVYVPGAFTPTGDGKNETIRPIHRNLTPRGYSFQIYDRWGMLVFETKDPYEAWDGKVRGKQVTTNTVFTYILRFRDLDNIKQVKTGTITLFVPH